MPKRKSKYEKKSFESTGGSSDTSANIYHSMLLSPAWIDLTEKQKSLYTICKDQYYSEKETAKRALFEPYTDLNIPNNIQPFFSLNKDKLVKTYKLYSPTNQQNIYRDIEGLISHGFIRCIASGATIRAKSIYQYSDKWRLWGTDEFEILPQEMTLSMRNKNNKNGDK